MRLDPTAQGLVYVPVQPVAPVHRVTRDAAQSFKPIDEANTPKPEKKALALEELRNTRAEVMKELSESKAAAPSHRFQGLDRDQLASIVFDRSGAYSLEERASVKQLVDTNDEAFLGRARELSDISGDERVFLRAQIDLEKSKSVLERAVPDAEKPVDIDGLKRTLDELNAAVGAPVGISLSYPNGLRSSGAPNLPLPNRDDASRVSAGATRAALVYREAGF